MCVYVCNFCAEQNEKSSSNGELSKDREKELETERTSDKENKSETNQHSLDKKSKTNY